MTPFPNDNGVGRGRRGTIVSMADDIEAIVVSDAERCCNHALQLEIIEKIINRDGSIGGHLPNPDCFPLLHERCSY